MTCWAAPMAQSRNSARRRGASSAGLPTTPCSPKHWRLWTAPSSRRVKPRTGLSEPPTRLLLIPDGSISSKPDCSKFAHSRKHRVEPDALAALATEMRAQLSAIEASGEYVALLDRQLSEARQAYSAAASALSAHRHEAASRLDAAVAAELA